MNVSKSSRESNKKSFIRRSEARQKGRKESSDGGNDKKKKKRTSHLLINYPYNNFYGFYKGYLLYHFLWLLHNGIQLKKIINKHLNKNIYFKILLINLALI